MKHLGRKLVVLASLLVVHAGCGGGGEDSNFTQAQAVEATKFGLSTYLAGSLFAVLELEGLSGNFDIPTSCNAGGGTMQFTGTLTVISDEQGELAMDAKADGCGTPTFAVDGTLHFEGPIESFDISGRYTFSGDTLSGNCSFDATATFSADGEVLTVVGTACGQDISDDYVTAEL